MLKDFFLSVKSAPVAPLANVNHAIDIANINFYKFFFSILKMFASLIKDEHVKEIFGQKRKKI